MVRRKNAEEMGLELSVQADISESLNMLTELGGNKNTMMRHILSGLGTAAKGVVKKSYRSSGLKKKSGQLYKSIERKVFKNGKAVIIQAKAEAKDKVFYGYALARGSKIVAKKGKYLTFQIDGKWIKKHSVQLPSRDFVALPVKKYLTSSSYKEKLEQLVNKEVEKLENKAKAKG